MKSHLLPKILLLIVLIFVGLHCFFRLKILFFYSSDIGGIEQYPTAIIQQLMLGIPLYNDPEIVPFRVVQLMPLYYKIAAFTGNLLHIDPNEPYQVLILSRSFSLICNILTLFFLYLIIKKHLFIHFNIALSLSLFFFFLLREWYFSRSDSLYILLHIISLYNFIFFLKSTKKQHLLFACVFGMLAFFTKQAGAMILIYMFVVLFLEKKYTNLMLFSVINCSLFLLFFQIFIGFENIFLWYKNNILGLRTGFDSGFYTAMFRYKGNFYIIGWLVLAFFMLKKYFFSSKSLEKNLVIGSIVAFLFAIITGAKNGASFNHWTELWIFTFLLLSTYLSENSNPKIYTFAPILLLFFATAITMTYSYYASIYTARKWRTDEPYRYESQRKVANYIKNNLAIKENEYIYTTFRDFLDLFLPKNTCAIHKDMIVFLHTPKTFLYPELFPKLQKNAAKYVVTSNTIKSEFLMDTEIIDTVNYKKIITIDDNYTIFELK